MTKHKIVSIVVISASLFLAGCADKAADVASTYVSPLQYQTYSCRQISQEAARVSARASQVAGVQDKNAESDAAATAVSLILFWPAAFFVSGNKENKAELSRLKGELEALEQINIQKNCGITFHRAISSPQE